MLLANAKAGEKEQAKAKEDFVDAELDPRAVRDLETHLLGQVIRPGDAEYDAARSVWNASIDRRPGARGSGG